MAESTPGARPIIAKAAKQRIAPKESGRPINRLTGGLMGQRPKQEASQVNVKAPLAKF
jgi:hypothetical protein